MQMMPSHGWSSSATIAVPLEKSMTRIFAVYKSWRKSNSSPVMMEQVVIPRVRILKALPKSTANHPHPLRHRPINRNSHTHCCRTLMARLFSATTTESLVNRCDDKPLVIYNTIAGYILDRSPVFVGVISGESFHVFIINNTIYVCIYMPMDTCATQNYEDDNINTHTRMHTGF